MNLQRVQIDRLVITEGQWPGTRDQLRRAVELELQRLMIGAPVTAASLGGCEPDLPRRVAAALYARLQAQTAGQGS